MKIKIFSSFCSFFTTVKFFTKMNFLKKNFQQFHLDVCVCVLSVHSNFSTHSSALWTRRALISKLPNADQFCLIAPSLQTLWSVVCIMLFKVSSTGKKIKISCYFDNRKSWFFKSFWNIVILDQNQIICCSICCSFFSRHILLLFFFQ